LKLLMMSPAAEQSSTYMQGVPSQVCSSYMLRGIYCTRQHRSV
jgi:hypothetical protein